MPTSSWRRKATRKWGRHARWLSCEGTFAVIAPCWEFSFFLWAMQDVADKAKAHLDQTGCGGGCTPVLHKVWQAAGKLILTSVAVMDIEV